MRRTDVLAALANEAMTVTTEQQAEYIGKRNAPIWSQLVTTRNISEIPGAWKAFGHSVGIRRMYEVAEDEAFQIEHPTMGWVVDVKKRTIGIGTNLTMELNRDFKALKTQLQNWLKDQNLPEAMDETKEILVADMFTNGAKTAGHSSFDNSVVGIHTPTYGSLVYDGKPLFAASGNDRTAKNGSTYYNSLGATSLTRDNLQTALILKNSTNAKREDGTPYNNRKNDYLLVNDALEFDAKEIIESDLVPENNNNAKNPVKNMVKIIASPYFTDTNAWVVGNKTGIHVFDSNDIMFDTAKDILTRKIVLTAYFSFANAVFSWKPYVAANLATS